MLTRWNPWQDVFDVQREMNDLLRQTFGTWSFPQRAQLAWAPAIDVFSREGDLVVRAELPGIDPENDVEISLQGGFLTIAGERRQEQRSEEGGYYRAETTYGSFRRQIAVPDGVEAEKIQASYRDGILEVVVPKAVELTQPKRIPVLTGEHQKALSARGKKS